MPYFGRRLRGFDAYDTVFTAPETRTSSPVRIPRNVNMMSEDLYGLIPCGEGAGYAGGIVSAAVRWHKSGRSYYEHIRSFEVNT